MRQEDDHPILSDSEDDDVTMEDASPFSAPNVASGRSQDHSSTGTALRRSQRVTARHIPALCSGSMLVPEQDASGAPPDNRHLDHNYQYIPMVGSVGSAGTTAVSPPSSHNSRHPSMTARSHVDTQAESHAGPSHSLPPPLRLMSSDIRPADLYQNQLSGSSKHSGPAQTVGCAYIYMCLI